ncbi:MAG: hypothetical protein D4Q77_00635 [Methanothrix sp.]|nr:MAG: hypothetical protein D4Q77_00635 [Methanothrix sp.]
MKKLIQIRIVHTPSDMGSMKEGLEKESMEKVGRQRWDENQRKIAKFWDEVESELDGLNLDYNKVRIYQDGLPCGGELGERIVRETADKGSRNYQIIGKLMGWGAIIEATESPELLLKEFEYIKAMVNAATEKEKIDAALRYDRMKDKLIESRDTFIAKAIGATLKDGEIGLLFIGAAHNVLPKLPDDIEAMSLD